MTRIVQRAAPPLGAARASARASADRRRTALALIAVVAIGGLLTGCGGGSNTTINPPASPATGPQSWHVTAGASTAQEAVQTLDFYPASLTIDAGDTVVWTFPAGEPHTVSLPAAGQDPSALPAPDSPAAQAPAGGSTYDGSTFTSSGFLLLGKSY